jgi:3-hydroxybutyryl-CoA dehydrogenase
MVERVLVVGGGTMGRGIAQVVAAAGIPVVLRELDSELAARAFDGIKKSLQRAVEKGKAALGDADVVLSRIRVTDSLQEGADAQLVIEAIVEDLSKKQALFAELDALLPPDSVLATNTSALSISRIASVTHRPERVLGMHFFNPVPVMKLVEVIRGERTAPKTVAAAKAFAERIGKTPVEVRESPGFVVNRLLIPFINEAAWACMGGIARREDIDTTMTLGAGHPMGPLALADLIGIDVVVGILETLERELGDPKYRPCPLLKDMMRNGTLGRKTGRGFFDYDGR